MLRRPQIERLLQYETHKKYTCAACTVSKKKRKKCIHHKRKPIHSTSATTVHGRLLEKLQAIYADSTLTVGAHFNWDLPHSTKARRLFAMC